MTGLAPGETRNFLFALDTPSAIAVTANESYIKGWFVSQDGDRYELWLVAGETRVQAFTGLPRPDVALHHNNNPTFKRSGFVAHVESPGPATVQLIARLDDREIMLADGIAVPALPETIARGGSKALEADVASLAYQPTLSILLPIPVPHPYLLSRSVESLRAQRYGRWQLCIASDSVEQSPFLDYLKETVRQDSRLKLVEAANDHPSELCAQALALAEGDFILRLQPGDELHPSALSDIVEALNTGDDINLVYTDEEEVDLYGNRGRRISKPDFDPEAFVSWNFIGPSVAIRRAAALQVGGYGAQATQCDGWDLLVRISEICRPEQIQHVAKALYSCRQGDDTVALLARQPKDKSSGGSCSETVSDHLKRIGSSAMVEPGIFAGSYRVRYHRGADSQTAVVVRAQDGSFQQAALAPNLDPQRTRVYESIGSGAELLADSRLPSQNQEGVVLPRDFTGSTADVFIFINRPLDTVNHHFVEELTAQAMRQDCGLVTGIALDRNGRVLHSGFRRTPADEWTDAFAGSDFFRDEMPRELHVVRTVDGVSDEFFAVKRSRLTALGGLAAILSAGMPQLVKNLVGLAHSDNTRVLVTPYAIATFDVVSPRDHLESEECMAENDKNNDDDLNGQPHAAPGDRRLLAAELRETANERNRLRRELAAASDALARAAASRSEGVEQRVEELTLALEAERRMTAGLQDSLSWKLTAPLRACLRLIRR